MPYIPKVAKVYVVELTLANTWYPILTEDQARSIMAVKIKSRYTYGSQPPNPFDYAFSATPDAGVSTGGGFVSNTGGGLSDILSPSSGIWARSPEAGTQLEIITYD